MDEVFNDIAETVEGRQKLFQILENAILLESGKLTPKQTQYSKETLRRSVGRFNYLVSQKYSFDVNSNGTLSISKKG
jgi:hypothetical protein